VTRAVSAGPRRRAAVFALAALSLTPGRSAAAQAGADAVHVAARVGRARVPRGDTVSVLVTLEMLPRYHVWPHEPVLPEALARLSPIATEISPVTLPAGAAIESVEWPDPTPVTVRYVGPALELLSYTERTAVRVLLRVAPGAATGRATAVFEVRYQTCDDRVCYAPATRNVTVRFRIIAAPS